MIAGRYIVQERLGAGGMGTVYRVEDTSLGALRAIKFLHEDLARNPGPVRRFLQEAEVVRRVRHRHVVEVFDVCEDPGSSPCYYVMELLAGEDLRARLAREPVLGWGQVRTIARQICEGLAVVHAHGIVHRDLKPANCFCMNNAEGEVFIKILDFGVAKAPRDEDGARLTRTGDVPGTMMYMAPEQFFQGEVDGRADLFSLGVMMYEMLSGRAPTMQEVGARWRGEPTAPLNAFNSTITPTVEGLIERAMHRDVALRFQSAEELAAALATIDAEPVPVRPLPGATKRPAPPQGDAELAMAATELVAPQSVAATLDERPATATAVPAAKPGESPRARRRRRVMAVVMATGMGGLIVASCALGWLSDAEVAVAHAPSFAQEDTPPLDPGRPPVSIPDIVRAQDQQPTRPAAEEPGTVVTEEALRTAIESTLTPCRTYANERLELNVRPSESGSPEIDVKRFKGPAKIRACINSQLKKFEKRFHGDLEQAGPLKLTLTLRASPGRAGTRSRGKK